MEREQTVDGGETRESAQLRSLVTIAAAVGASRRFDDLLELAAEEALAALDGASLSISHWDQAADVLRTLINVGRLGPAEERYPKDETYRVADWPSVAGVLRHGRPYVAITDDPVSDPQVRQLLDSLDKSSCAAVPILFDGSVWGEFFVTSAHGQAPFADGDVRFLQAVASQVALGLAHASYVDRLQELAFQDPLTGLGNRRALDVRLDAALDAARDRGITVSVLVCDVDRLKLVNDELGHDAGDALLRAVAAVLREVVVGVPGASAHRIGGDEFCLLLEGHDERVARRLAETAGERLAQYPTPRLSVSCGVASTTLTLEPGELLRAADAAQYTAKRSGPGRVHVALPSTPADAPTGSDRQRRRLRNRHDPDLGALTVAVLERLDGELQHAGAVDRLETVATTFAAGTGNGGWMILCWDAVTDTLNTVRRTLRVAGTAHPDPRVHFAVDGERAALCDHRLAAELLHDRRAAVVNAGDNDGDPGERALLAEYDYDAVLLAGVRNGSQGWLLRLYASGDPTALERALPVVRLLVAEAVAAAALPLRGDDDAQVWQLAQ